MNNRIKNVLLAYFLEDAIEKEKDPSVLTLLKKALKSIEEENFNIKLKGIEFEKTKK